MVSILFYPAKSEHEAQEQEEKMRLPSPFKTNQYGIDHPLSCLRRAVQMTLKSHRPIHPKLRPRAH
jgi:hypothetical protein